MFFLVFVPVRVLFIKVPYKNPNLQNYPYGK